MNCSTNVIQYLPFERARSYTAFIRRQGVLRPAMRLRKSVLFLACVLLGTAGTVSAKPRSNGLDPYPSAAVAYAAVVDGELLWGRNVDMRRAPASLTKLLTALVLLDSNWHPEAVLDVSHVAAHITHPRVGLHTGDTVIAGDALTAMLMHSANDACMVLVENAAPSPEAFALRMNAKAQQLGMRDSHFVHPCGFDAEDQYSTVTDLLRLARAAHANPRIAQIVSQQQYSIATGKGRILSFKNTNQLLGRLDGVMGLKTGYTAQAGHCLIAVAEQSGHRVWLVLLDSQRRWQSAHRIIVDAFAAAERGPHSRLAGATASL
jgi:serine-type D-Ala-D-Ala carboxypeptidase (penicillin-binding protein 5/6)